MRNRRKLDIRLHPTQEKRLGNPLILIIDDDIDLLRELKDVLDSHYNVVITSDPSEALATARKLRPDLIITDLRMQPMSGLQLIDILQNSRDTKDIPILVMTGYHDEKGNKIVMHLGPNRVFLKPFHPVDLMSRIEEILNERKSLQK